MWENGCLPSTAIIHIGENSSGGALNENVCRFFPDSLSAAFLLPYDGCTRWGCSITLTCAVSRSAETVNVGASLGMGMKAITTASITVMRIAARFVTVI